METVVSAENSYVQLEVAEQVTHIVATHRNPIPNDHQHPKVTWVQVDVRKEETIEALAMHLKDAGLKPNFIINCIGILHTSNFGPERTWRHLDASTMQDVFAINAFAVALLGKHLISLMPREGRTIFASLSARLEASQTIDWAVVFYRASKTAHNMFVKTLSLEARRKHPELAIFLFTSWYCGHRTVRTLHRTL